MHGAYLGFFLGVHDVEALAWHHFVNLNIDRVEIPVKSRNRGALSENLRIFRRQKRRNLREILKIVMI